MEQQKAEAVAPYERLTPAIRKRVLAVFDTEEKRGGLYIQWRAERES